MPGNNGGGSGAKCVNMFLFISTIIFIIDSSLDIAEMKNKKDNDIY